MQESRLFRIVYYLLEKGKATAPQLAEEFEVSVRTIYRDIDSISSAGIPIYAETGRNGGIRLYDDFVLDKVVLSQKEKQAVLTAMQSLDLTGISYEKETLRKLSALFQTQANAWYEIDFSRWGNQGQDQEKFEVLKQAVLYHTVMEIQYVSSYGETTERAIHPLKLVYKSKEWYVKAYCEEKQAIRLFKCSRIIRWRQTERTFEEMEEVDEKQIQTTTYPKIQLRFPKEMAYRVYDEFDPAQIQTTEHGSYLVTAAMPIDQWLVGFLLSFGSYVEVLEPASLRETLAAQAKEIYEKHKP